MAALARFVLAWFVDTAACVVRAGDTVAEAMDDTIAVWTGDREEVE